MNNYEVLTVTHKKDGTIKEIYVHDYLKPMTELEARKMAWAMMRKGADYRIRAIGDSGIGEPHRWLDHAPPAFFEYIDRVNNLTYRP